MNNLKRTTAALALTLTLSFLAMADSPCSTDPGETHTPPCSVSQPTTAEPASEVAEESSSTASDTVAVSQAAIETLLDLLSLL